MRLEATEDLIRKKGRRVEDSKGRRNPFGRYKRSDDAFYSFEISNHNQIDITNLDPGAFVEEG